MSRTTALALQLGTELLLPNAMDTNEKLDLLKDISISSQYVHVLVDHLVDHEKLAYSCCPQNLTQSKKRNE